MPKNGRRDLIRCFKVKLFDMKIVFNGLFATELLSSNSRLAFKDILWIVYNTMFHSLPRSAY